jgi:RluA family pseudouridine synthase
MDEPLRILFRDEEVLAIDKPAGALSVPGRAQADAPALSLRVAALAPGALPVHRLDRDTSGILLFALGRDAHRALNASFESRRAEKRYLALCRGELLQSAVCELPLVAGRAGSMRVARADEKGALPARTELLPLEQFAGATLVEARPRTGRTHQIRVHLAALGHPLLLDPRYGQAAPIFADELFAAGPPPSGAAREVALGRTPLHAAALRIPHPSGRGYLQLESPTPADLARCLELLRAQRRRGERGL